MKRLYTIPLRYDALQIGWFYLAFLTIQVFLILGSLTRKEFYSVELLEEGLKSSFLTFCNALLPALFAFLVLSLFSANMEENTFPFVRTLPVSMFQVFIFRFLRLMLLALPGYAIAIWIGWRSISAQLGRESIELIKFTLDNAFLVFGCTFLLLSCASLFFMVVTKSFFYSISIVTAYAMIDAFMAPRLYPGKELLLLRLPVPLSDQLLASRWVYFAIAVGFFLASIAWIHLPVFRKWSVGRE